MATIEQRITLIEQEIQEIKQHLQPAGPEMGTHPWDKVFGSFAESEGFDDAVRLGREYRESLRPQAPSNAFQAS